MRRMPADHILIVVHDFSAGGTENIAFRLAKEWLDRGRRVSILAGAPDGPMRARIPEGAGVRVLSPPIPRSPGSRLRLGAAMTEDIRALAPDILFLPGNFHFILAAAIRRAFPRLPIAAKVSNPLLPRIPGWLRGFARRKLGQRLSGIDSLIFMAPELAEAARPLLPDGPADIIPEPNLRHGYVPLPRTRPDGPPLILCLARLEPQKNLALALRAFAALTKTTDARLLILGEGAQRPMLERLVHKLGLDGLVAMPGFSSDTEARLAQASALLVTSRYEGYPAAVVEALAADVPVVSTACTPVLASLIRSPLHGRVVAKATPEALAGALAETLALPFASGGKRAEAVRGNDARASADAYLALFDRLVEARR